MNNAGPSGFAHAPVTKGLLATMLLLSVGSTMLRHNSHVGLRLSLFALTERLHFWRIITHNLLLTSPQEFLLTTALLYYFRVFERQMGSVKYAAFLIFSAALSTSMQLAMSSGKALLFGPHGMLFANMVQFYFDIPVTLRFRAFGLKLTDKSFTYVLALQLCILSMPTSLFAALSGVFSGLAYRSEALPLRRLQVPKPVAALFRRVYGPVVEFHGPTPARARIINANRPAAAAMQEIARMPTPAPAPPQNQVENLPGGQGYSDTLIPGMGMPGPMGSQRRPHGAAPSSAVPPNEEDVTMLTSMGFSRSAVLEALSRSNNDVQAATNLLLDTTS